MQMLCKQKVMQLVKELIAPLQLGEPDDGQLKFHMSEIHPTIWWPIGWPMITHHSRAKAQRSNLNSAWIQIGSCISTLTGLRGKSVEPQTVQVLNTWLPLLGLIPGSKTFNYVMHCKGQLAMCGKPGTALLIPALPFPYGVKCKHPLLRLAGRWE